MSPVQVPAEWAGRRLPRLGRAADTVVPIRPDIPVILQPTRFPQGLGPTDCSPRSRPFAAPPPHLEIRSLHVPSERADITHRGRAEAVAHRPPQRVEPGGNVGIASQGNRLGDKPVEIGRDELREPRFAEQ